MINSHLSNCAMSLFVVASSFSRTIVEHTYAEEFVDLYMVVKVSLASTSGALCNALPWAFLRAFMLC